MFASGYQEYESRETQVNGALDLVLQPVIEVAELVAGDPHLSSEYVHCEDHSRSDISAVELMLVAIPTCISRI